jgi:hypothetical protein
MYINTLEAGIIHLNHFSLCFLVLQELTQLQEYEGQHQQEGNNRANIG